MLEIAKTSTLELSIVCRNCAHHLDNDNPDIWIDLNGDIYYQGDNKETLAAFLFYHG